MWIIAESKLLMYNVMFLSTDFQFTHQNIDLNLCFFASFLYLLVFSTSSLSLSKHTKKLISMLVFIHLWQGVSRSRWRALCHMVNHPSVAAHLQISPGTKHTNPAQLREREASTMLHFQDTERNTCGKRDLSQDIRQRLTVKQQNCHLCWLQLVDFLLFFQDLQVKKCSFQAMLPGC